MELQKDVRDCAVASIKRYFEEALEQEIGDLKASLLLDFALKELGPILYNRGVADAQARMAEMVAELDSSCYEPEFGYWKR
jgi:uncharacterized protein (DUF2164 family)